MAIFYFLLFISKAFQNLKLKFTVTGTVRMLAMLPYHVNKRNT